LKKFFACMMLVATIGFGRGAAHADLTDAALNILQELITAVEDAGIPDGITRSLVSKLLTAARSIERGDIRAASGQLAAFEGEVRAQYGKALTNEQVEGALSTIAHVKIALDPGPAPVLKNLLVNFAAWDPVTDSAGDFNFLASEEKVFLEFGAVVITPDGPKTLPTFEYRLPLDTVVISPLNGTVASIRFQDETNDYEIHLMSSPTSPFLVVVDHLTDLLVSEGDAVAAGQSLGKVGPFSLTLGRTELQVVNFIEEINYCPFELFDPDLALAFQQKVTDLMADWETFKGDASIYDQPTMVEPGCVVHTLQ
jgi:hypothetical protein